MPALIRPASLMLDAEGMPYAPEYGDIYHSRAGGYAQARGVFLAGNDLPHAWRGRRSFTILETGFGLGTNFLATWAAWREKADRPRRLHYVSIELHPFNAADLLAWHGRDAEMAPLGAALAKAWPVLTPGVHRLEFERGQVVLTLVLGDVAAALAQLRLRADAFYLDGFSPARNPHMWCGPVYEGLARLAAPAATLATYTVAHKVFNGLVAAGFTVRRVPGFGGKQEMLAGRIGTSAAAVPTPHGPQRHALVIGAGIAGVTAADRLAARDWRVTLLDSADGVARGASSTPAGAMHALLSRDDSRLARFTRAAYLHMDRLLAPYTVDGPRDWLGVSGRVHCLGEGESMEVAQAMLADLGFPPGFVSVVDTGAASGLAGTRIARAGHWFPRTSWLHAGTLCTQLLAARAGRVELRMGQAVASLRQTDEGWAACDAAGRILATAPVAVLAAGLHLPRLAGEEAVLPLQRVRGQLTGVPAELCRAPGVIVGGEGYCLPAVQGVMWTGASYGPNDEDAAVRPEENVQNLHRLEQLLPDNDFAAPPARLASHVGFRAVSPDRLPLVGALPQWNAITRDLAHQRGPALSGLARQPGLYVTGGMGSRGLTWAALAGEMLASMIEGEPLPLEAELLDAVDPARFALRRLRRAGNDKP